MSRFQMAEIAVSRAVPVFNRAQSSRAEFLGDVLNACMIVLLPAPLNMVAEGVDVLIKGLQAGVDGGEYRAARGSWLRCTYALAPTAATKIKFQLLVDTALGMTTNACAASRTSPNCC
jgi:hypothetical protein